MDWKKRRQIADLVDEILECNVLNRPPIMIINDIMKQHGIIFEERNEHDDEFCGVYMVMGDNKIIFVNSNLYEPRKNFTIAHELGHHFLGHTLSNGAIICDQSAMDSRNKKRPEQEKQADYFAGCFLMPKNLMKEKKKDYEDLISQRVGLLIKPNKQYYDDLNRYLRDYFCVSKEAMGYRLVELRMV